jgi:GNAT superfamily N-acetyltransferase
MITTLKTTPNHPDFKKLVTLLDQDLAISDGDEHGFYNQFNSSNEIKHGILIYVDNTIAACGAIKEYDSDTMEIKRMYTTKKHRRKGIASNLLTQLESWVLELGYKRCVLETGKKQPEAIALYQRNGFKITSNYDQYKGKENSVCFEKVLNVS